MTFSDDQITAMATAMRAEANRFISAPVEYYIQNEAEERGLVERSENGWVTEEAILEGYKILVRAAISGL